MWIDPGEGARGRQGFCVREWSTPPENELAAVVTRSRHTDEEQISQTEHQTDETVLMPVSANPLNGLVGAPGLEPGTR